jgi:16S rRNA (guanine1516-N2)-methyltransferase
MAASDCPDEPRHPVLYFHPDAAVWVSRWHGRFRLVESLEPPTVAVEPILWAAPAHLELRVGTGRGQGAWVPEAEVRRRARQTPELLKACGAGSGMTVLDAMAGWGLDGLVLAATGARVTMVEREPLMHALQEDLIRRLGVEGIVPIRADAFGVLEAAATFDVVYLDPMFPPHAKHALPNKRMQYLAVVAGAGDARPLDVWVDLAVQRARRRVVVKRRLHDLATQPPDWQIRGRSVRYDVYRGRGP